MDRNRGQQHNHLKECVDPFLARRAGLLSVKEGRERGVNLQRQGSHSRSHAPNQELV